MPSKIKFSASPKEVENLKGPWQSRIRMDKAVTGAIELSFLRGYQAGYEDRHKGKKARYFTNVSLKDGK